MGRSDEHGEGSSSGHFPVTQDWPRGYGEASWWPIVVVAGVVGIYVGLGLVFVTRRSTLLLEPLIGPAVAVLGLLAFVVGLLGWIYHGFVDRYWERTPVGSAVRFRWGMGLFLCTEVATFGSGLAYYGYVRAGAWPPGPLPHLLTSLVVVNTVLLVTSSVTLHYADAAMRADRRRRAIGLLAGTVVLGVAFLLGQLREYATLIAEEGFTISDGVYASAFFGLTGLHGLHVGFGVILLSIVLARAVAGHYSADRHASMTTVTMYWHFVDGVWLVLVVVLYLGAVMP